MKFWPNATTAGPQAESSTTTVESQAPSIAESSPSQTAEPATTAAQEALEACQAKVRAADEVIKQGTTGVEHWAGHIQAQKDGNAGKISPEQMKARFKATRLKGPGDLTRYDDARSAYQDLEGSCDEVAGGDAVATAAFADCNERSKAQKPLMTATNAAMKDWRVHLTFMQRNAVHQAGTPAQALDTWLRQYAAAPKNIRAFENATDDFDAPSC
ncbi:MAG TPA: hypothetical protein VFP81_04605 [Propionibacteriaceae bacterium]|nr:hypothetical protein [Propionibacteriaceae bacterium]